MHYFSQRGRGLLASFVLCLVSGTLLAQQQPYDIFPEAKPPFYRIRYEASTKPGELIFPVSYTLWIPPGVQRLRGLIIHQHGCGEGSCSSGLTGAYDLHWQALARKHDCGLLAPAYEQPQQADCQMWCDPRNGSLAAFQRALVDLGDQSNHAELPTIPWALWGHSGGGHWAGGITLLHPERIVATWLRSGVPLLKANPERPQIKPHDLPAAALSVPLMCNMGTKEGVTIKQGRFAKVWPANQDFFHAVRSRGGLIGVAVDPLTSHECGNQRYLAIPWLDACLTARLPEQPDAPLLPMPETNNWLAEVAGFQAWPASTTQADPLTLAWLPDEQIAKSWMQYVKDTVVADTTPPPAPTRLRIVGRQLRWACTADLESGLAFFVIKQNGSLLTQVPESPQNRFGRPLFQNLLYSDTPTQPLAEMTWAIPNSKPGDCYEVTAVNTVGLASASASIIHTKANAQNYSPRLEKETSTLESETKRTGPRKRP